MMREGLYRGEVVHARLRPVRHKLSYRVFSLLVDVDRLDGLAGRLRLFGYNRPSVLSIRDADHGDGGPLRQWLDRMAREAGVTPPARYLMLAYPRVLGFVFNPLTTYFGLDDEGVPRLMVYEVNNTFGDRHTYVLPVEGQGADGLIHQSCAKRMYVSPFNEVEGEYLFHVTPPADEVTVGVALRTGKGPLLRAHFRGRHEPITDAGLMRALIAYGWMTVGVIAGIHWEALKLWVKGLRLKDRPKVRRDGDAHRPARPGAVPRIRSSGGRS